MPNLSYFSHDLILDGWGDDLYLGLLTAAPNPDGTGINEPNALHGYARQTFTYESAQAEGVTTLTNDGAIVFGPAVSAPWDTVSFFGVFDAETNGNLLVYGRARTARTNPTGEAISLSAGEVQLRLR